MSPKARSLFVAVAIGYVLLLAALFLYLPSPWNYALGGLVALKGVVFLAIMKKASSATRQEKAAASQKQSMSDD